jgi:hypothetical protein
MCDNSRCSPVQYSTVQWRTHATRKWCVSDTGDLGKKGCYKVVARDREQYGGVHTHHGIVACWTQSIFVKRRAVIIVSIRE